MVLHATYGMVYNIERVRIWKCCSCCTVTLWCKELLSDLRDKKYTIEIWVELSWVWFVAMLSEFTFYAEQHQWLLCRWSRKCNPCRQGDEGKMLLSLAGERTHALRWMSLARFSKSIHLSDSQATGNFHPDNWSGRWATQAVEVEGLLQRWAVPDLPTTGGF